MSKLAAVSATAISHLLLPDVTLEFCRLRATYHLRQKLITEETKTKTSLNVLASRLTVIQISVSVNKLTKIHRSAVATLCLSTRPYPTSCFLPQQLSKIAHYLGTNQAVPEVISQRYSSTTEYIQNHSLCKASISLQSLILSPTLRHAYHTVFLQY